MHCYDKYGFVWLELELAEVLVLTTISAAMCSGVSTEHSGKILGVHWQILGVASSAEHRELSVAAERQTSLAHTVISIGSVLISRAARNDRATRAMELVRHGIQDRLPVTIALHEISHYCNRSATEHTGTRAPRSWSDIVEAISRSVTTYQRAAHATEQIACADITDMLKDHVQELLQKCVPGAYLRDCALSIITTYIWNRICWMTFLLLLDDIVTHRWPPENLSHSEINDALELIEACLNCLRKFCDEILTDLTHYICPATEPTKTSLAQACHTWLDFKKSVTREQTMSRTAEETTSANDGGSLAD